MLNAEDLSRLSFSLLPPPFMSVFSISCILLQSTRELMTQKDSICTGTGTGWRKINNSPEFYWTNFFSYRDLEIFWHVFKKNLKSQKHLKTRPIFHSCDKVLNVCILFYFFFKHVLDAINTINFQIFSNKLKCQFINYEYLREWRTTVKCIQLDYIRLYKAIFYKKFFKHCFLQLYILYWITKSH